MTVKNILLFLLMSFFLANFFFGQGNTGKEIDTNKQKQIDLLLKKLEDTEEGREQVDILDKLSYEYHRIDPGKALYYSNQGLELSQKINYKNGIAAFYKMIGLIYLKQGNYKQASDYYFKSLKIYKELGDKKGAATSYNNIGIVYFRQGNYEQALDYFFRSLKIKEELGDKQGIARFYNNIGIIYYKQGNYSQALDYYFKSLKICEEIEDKTELISYTYNNIGNIYGEKGNYKQALDYFFRSLKIKEELGDKQGIARFYNNIGNIHKDQGNYSQALKYQFKSLKIREEIGDNEGIALTLNIIGDIYYEQKEFDRALEVWLRSKKINEEIGAKVPLADSYLGMGKCYKTNKQYKKALDNLTRGLKIAQDINTPKIIKETARELAEVYSQTGKYKEAYQFYVLFKEKSDFLRNEEKSKKITQLEMQYEFDKKQKQQQLEQQKKDLEKEAELKQQRFLKYTFSGVAILLALLFYTRYRLKVKVNRQLRKEIRDREHAEAELVKSMKLETVGILSAGIAHDFNNLLTIIACNLELAKDVLQDPDPQPVPFIENAEKASAQAIELVKKFLTISEGGWITKSKVTLPDVMKDAIDAAPLLSEMPLSISFPGNLKPLFGDARQLRQVLANLLLNAHEASLEMKEEKKINISAENIILPKNNQWKLNEGEYVKVSVTDNGKGIPGDLLPKIFDPYVSTKERGHQKGMGMGLAVSNAIVQKHDGYISVTSASQQGTTFDLYLPVFKEDSGK